MLLRRKIRKLILPVSLLLILAGYLGWIYTHPDPVSYMTVRLSAHDIHKQVFANGTLYGQNEVDVGAQVSGQIEKLHVQLGDEVKKGDLLCEIDPKTLENKLKTAHSQIAIIKAKIAAKEADLTKLRFDYNRRRDLLKVNATSKTTAEAAEAAFLVARAELEELNAEFNQAQISVEDAQTNLDYTRITAPMDGTVYAVLVDEGQTVNANQTTPTILRLANMDKMIVETEISEADVVNVKPGLACTFSILGLPHRIFKGKLGKIAPAPASATDTSSSSASSSATNSQAIYYNAKVLVDNTDRVLRMNMSADVTINVADRQGVQALPLTALRQETGSTGMVYVLDAQNQIEEREIKTGLRDDQFIEVLEGLEPTERVVIGEDVETAEQAAMSSASKGKKRRF